MDAALIAQSILVHLYEQYAEQGRDEVAFYFDLFEEIGVSNKTDIYKALNYLENHGLINDVDRDEMSAFISSEGIVCIDNGGLSYIRELC